MNEHNLEQLVTSLTKELSDQRDRFNNIVERDVDAHLVVSLDREILYANQAAKLLIPLNKDCKCDILNYPFLTDEVMEMGILGVNSPNVIVERRVLETEWEGTPAFLISLRDVSERRQIEDDLRRSEAQTRAFMDHAAEGVLIIDDHGFIRLLNPAVERIFGYNSKELINKNIKYLMTSSFHAKHDEYLKTYRNSRKAEYNGRSLELVGRHKNGILFAYESTAGDFYDGEQWLFIVILRDISYRKETEKELRLWSKVFETALAAIVITNAEGIIQAVSNSFTKTTGYSAQEVIGKNPRVLKSGRHDAKFYSLMWKSLIEQGHWEGEIWNRRKNGEFYPEWLSISASRDSRGRLTNFIAIFRDITADISLRDEVILAGKIQQSSLPPTIENQLFYTKNIYKPYNFVSGDFFDYLWIPEKQIFHGIMLDVMGHGLATALQISALRVLFRQTTEKLILLHERIAWLNRESIPYFTNGSFAAAVFFDIDFRQGTITIGSAGISYVLQIVEGSLRLITLPGLFLGISENEVYEQLCLPLKPGESFIFLSDGLFDNLEENDKQGYTDMEKVFVRLQQIINCGLLTDDATAMGVYIKSIIPEDSITRLTRVFDVQ